MDCIYLSKYQDNSTGTVALRRAQQPEGHGNSVTQGCAAAGAALSHPLRGVTAPAAGDMRFRDCERCLRFWEGQASQDNIHKAVQRTQQQLSWNLGKVSLSLGFPFLLLWSCVKAKPTGNARQKTLHGHWLCSSYRVCTDPLKNHNIEKDPTFRRTNPIL